jgi:hypothetical protein
MYIRSSIYGIQSIIQSVLDVTNEKPWLWAVFVFVVVLPLILLIYYCCCTASSPAEPARVRITLLYSLITLLAVE